MVRTGVALLLLAAVSAAAGDDPGCPFCGEDMAAAEGEAWYEAYRCGDSACDARLQVFSDGTEKGIRIDEDGNRRIIVKDPRLVEEGDSARKNRPTRRRVRQDPADSITLFHPVTRPNHAIGLPGHAIGLPGHAIGRPGHAIERPGHAITLPSHAIGRPGHAIERPGHAVGRPNHAIGLPGVAVVRPRTSPIVRPRTAPILRPTSSPIVLPRSYRAGRPVDNTGPRFVGRRYSAPRSYSKPRRYSKRR